MTLLPEIHPKLWTTMLKLRSFISQKFPNASIILTKPIMRSDTAAGNVIIEEVNIQLNDFDFNMIDNINLSRAHVNDRGLHLNTKGVCHSLQKIWLKVFRNDEINKG